MRGCVPNAGNAHSKGCSGVSTVKADAGFRLQPCKSPIKGVPRVEATDGTAIKLIELIAIDGVVEKIGEIVVELQVRTNGVRADLGLAVLAGMRKIPGQAKAAGDAAVGSIERTKAPDNTLVDRTLRDLVGRIPGIRIGHAGEREAI